MEIRPFSIFPNLRSKHKRDESQMAKKTKKRGFLRKKLFLYNLKPNSCTGTYENKKNRNGHI